MLSPVIDCDEVLNEESALGAQVSAALDHNSSSDDCQDYSMRCISFSALEHTHKENDKSKSVNFH